MSATEAETAYFAGILDGEGTFTVYKTTAQYHSLIAVASTCKELMDWIQSKFPASVAELGAPSGNREISYQWQMRQKLDMQPLLKAVIPLLVVKKLHAQLLLKYTNEFATAYRGKRISREDIELRDAYCALFADLNARGTGSNAKRAAVVRLFASGGVAL